MDAVGAITVVAEHYADRVTHGGMQHRPEKAQMLPLGLRRKALGDDHPDVAASHNNLADLLIKKGDFSEAEANSRTALAIWRTALGADNPAVTSALVSLGRIMHPRPLQ